MSSGDPISLLRAYLAGLHRLYKAGDYDLLVEAMEDPKEVRRLAALIGDVDEFLTDKRRSSDSQYERDAVELLENSRPVIHLSDGGYSRLTLAYDTPKLFWLDKGASTPKVVERWGESRKAYEKGDIRPPTVPGGQRKRPQNQQMREQRRYRKKYHERNRSKENRESRKRYRLIYKRKRKMIERKQLYQKDRSRYKRRPPKPYTKPDKKAVAQRYAGDIFLYDQHNPANNEIKQPGADVNYRAEGPSTWAMHPDLQQGIAQTDGGISDQTRNVPPGSSRVIPDAMKQQLQDNYFKAAGRRPRRISKAIALNSIYSRIRDIKYGSARLIGPSTPTEWLISYVSHNGDVHRVHVGGHEDSTGRVSLSVRTASTAKTAAATIPEILSNCGPLVTDRSKGLTFRRKRRSPSGMTTWAVTGSTGDVYTVKVKPVRKDKRVKAVAKMPVRVSCSCPYWRWQGPEHWGKQNDYLYGKPRGTASFPIVRDPLGEHWACKHMIAVLQLVKKYRWASGEEAQWSYEGPYALLPDPGKVVARYLRKQGSCERSHAPKSDPKPEE